MKVYSFGCNEQRQLGRGEESPPSVPLPVQLPQGKYCYTFNTNRTELDESSLLKGPVFKHKSNNYRNNQRILNTVAKSLVMVIERDNWTFPRSGEIKEKSKGKVQRVDWILEKYLRISINNDWTSIWKQKTGWQPELKSYKRKYLAIHVLHDLVHVQKFVLRGNKRKSVLLYFKAFTFHRYEHNNLHLSYNSITYGD